MPENPLDRADGHIGLLKHAGSAVSWGMEEECLNQNVFVSLAEARRMVEAWRQDYNRERPHSALAGLSPEQFRASCYRNIKKQAATNFSVGYQAG